MVEPSGDVLILQVLPGPDEDAEQLDDLTAMLREELLELDVAAVEPICEIGHRRTRRVWSWPLRAGWRSISVRRA